MQEKLMQSKLEETLARYVAMRTVPSDIEACTAAINTLSDELKDVGMFTHIGGPAHPWVIATTSQEAMQKKHVKILFVVHFDVVPPQDETHTVLRITDNKLFGRGVYDMKFAAACAKEVAAKLAEQGKLADYDFGILFTTDEEMGGYDGAGDFLREGWRCDLAIVPDGGYDWSIEARAKGLLYVYLEAEGRSAHSSRPWMGDNPISRLAPALDAITKKFPNDDQLGTIVSVNCLETNNSGIEQTTQIPSWAKAGISIRAFTIEEQNNAFSFIEEIATQHNLKANAVLNDPPVHLMQENPLVKAFIETAAEVHGEPIELSDAFAASDARHFAEYEIPTVLMYPSGGDHHGPHEWIVRSDLYKYYKLCQQYVERVAHKGNTIAEELPVESFARDERVLQASR